MIKALSASWTYLSLKVGDALFGYVLSWSRDLTLLIIISLSLLILLSVRRIACNQTALRAMTLDMQTLNRLLGDAPRTDRDVHSRLRRARARIARMRLAAELPGAFLSLALIGWMLMWAWERLQYMPPRAGEQMYLSAHLPASRIGGFAHLVPHPDFRTNAGWVRPLTAVGEGKQARAQADWMLRPQAAGRFELKIRSDKTTMSHVVRVGSGPYTRPLQRHDARYATEITMKEYRPFNFVPPIPLLGLHGWLVAYLAVVVPAFLFARRRLRIW